MFGRYKLLKRILTLDPQRDCQEIVYLVGALEYPWLNKKALEFALFRTYAVPYVSRVLAASGQFERHGQKRYDDTALMLSGIAERGYDSDFGRKAIQRMNELHGRWKIRNSEMLYVLSTFIFEPVRWHQRFGWRTPTAHEQAANYYFWAEVGKRMGIQDIPPTLTGYERFNIDYEQRHFVFDPANQLIGEATIQIFLGWYPRLLRPLVRQGLLSFMDEPLRAAMGLPKANRLIALTVTSGLRLFGRLLRFFPPRRKPYHFTEQPNRTYPLGYAVEELGPHREEQPTRT